MWNERNSEDLTEIRSFCLSTFFKNNTSLFSVVIVVVVCEFLPKLLSYCEIQSKSYELAAEDIWQQGEVTKDVSSESHPAAQGSSQVRNGETEKT